jgi:hypothetical protein
LVLPILKTLDIADNSALALVHVRMAAIREIWKALPRKSTFPTLVSPDASTAKRDRYLVVVPQVRAVNVWTARYLENREWRTVVEAR